MMQASGIDLTWLESRVAGAALRAGQFGIEREALRVLADARLSASPHPAEFGDKLANPCVTVDFSESQLELITPPCNSVDEALRELLHIQHGVEDVLARQGEYLWPLSMPTNLPAEEQIPIAKFSDTPEGRMRELYRLGLANRYGRRMQMISGIHFNFSFSPELFAALGQPQEAVAARTWADTAYFRMARNFLRHRWLLVWLTGASPAADESFRPVVRQQVQTVKACCRGCKAFIDEHEQHATSLRVSRYGYADTAFSDMPVSFNSLAEYGHDIRALMATPSERFRQLPLMPDGRPGQINDRVLQLESEFYAAIRLKGRVKPGESHLAAMDRDGVAYAEVRVLDLNPFADAAIDLDTLRFAQVLVLACLLGPDTPIHSKEWAVLQENHHRVALSGRHTVLPMCSAVTPTTFRDMATPLFERLTQLARLMDRDSGTGAFTDAVQQAVKKFADPGLLPSARVWAAMQRARVGHVAFGASLLKHGQLAHLVA